MTSGRPRHGLRLALLLLLAAAVRLHGWDDVGLDHFDEGGYAMSAAAVADGTFDEERYPLQHFLSPPFQFGTAGLAMRSVGVEDRVLTAVSVVLGVATVGLAYLAALRWFGPAAALVSGLLIAAADFTVLYSRSGLTDTAFGFWFLLALVGFAEAERRGSTPWALAAGIAMGLAWNTKYHGWLAAGVAGAALLPMVLAARRLPWRAIGRIALASSVAAALYLPWALFIMDQPGGYARVASEHAYYLWPTRALQHLWAHVEVQLYLDGWLGRLAPGIAAALVAAGAAPSAKTRARIRAAWVALAGLLAGSTVVIGLAALYAVARRWRSPEPGVRIALAFFATFSVLTPLYRPYPRLILPWLLAAALLAGDGLAEFVRGGPADTGAPVRTRRRGRPARAAVAMAAAVILVAAWVRPPWEAARTYRPKDGFRDAVASLAARLPRDVPVVVWGEPAAVFYLRQAGFEARHVDDLVGLEALVQARSEALLVTSIYAGMIGVERERARNAPSVRLAPLAEAPVRRISDVRLLDDMEPDEARGFVAEPDSRYDLRVFVVHSDSSAPSGGP